MNDFSTCKIFVTALVQFVCTLSLAQEKPGAAKPVENKEATDNLVKVGKDKRFKLDFDDELVNGKAANPEVDFIYTRQIHNYKMLIKLRDDFIPEAEKGRVEYNGKK